MGLLGAIKSFLGIGGDVLPERMPYQRQISATPVPLARGEPIPQPSSAHPGHVVRTTSRGQTRWTTDGARSVDQHPGLLWLGRGSSLWAAGYGAKDPLVYVTERSQVEGHPAFLDLDRPVQAPYATDPGYWPSWEGLSPSNRGAFLAWLRDGRRQPGFNIGLVFLYFYGLERRVVMDRADTTEIHGEICGLLHAYGANRSFRGYAASLLAVIHAIDRDCDVAATISALAAHQSVPAPVSAMPTVAVPGTVVPYSFPYCFIPADLVDVILAIRTEPIDAALATSIVQVLPQGGKATVQKSVWDEFAQVFATRFAVRWPQGIAAVAPADRIRTKLEYKWAAHFPGQTAPRLNVPSSVSVTAHWDGLVEVWNTCTTEISQLSRLQAQGVSDPRALFEALPADLRQAAQHPDYPAWEDWYAKIRDAHGFATVTVAELVARSKTACPADGKVRPSAARGLAARVEALGFALEPDPRIAGKGLDLADQRVIYRPVEGHVVLPGQAYIGLQTIVELCLAVALADGSIDDAEIEHIFGMLDRDDELPAPERERLRAHVAYQQAVGGDIGAVSANRLGKLSAASQSVIASMVVAIALADGKVTSGERNALRKVYRALGRPIAELDSLLSPAPAAAGAGTGDDAQGITINWAAVEALQRETNDVQHLLGKALAECVQDVDSGSDDNKENEKTVAGSVASESEVIVMKPPQADVSAATSTPPADLHPVVDGGAVADFRARAGAALNDLDQLYVAVLAACASRDSMPAADFRAICKSAGVMPAAAVEAINAWADETLGDFLISGDGPYTIDTRLLAKISKE